MAKGSHRSSVVNVVESVYLQGIVFSSADVLHRVVSHYSADQSNVFLIDLSLVLNFPWSRINHSSL